MYFRVQETHLDTGTQYRETMSSELLQQKTSSVQYYISTKQAITFLREKNKQTKPFSTISRCKEQQRRRQQGSSQTKNVPTFSKFRLLAGLKLVLRALTFSRCQSYRAGFGSKLLEAVEVKSSKHSIIPLPFCPKLQS